VQEIEGQIGPSAPLSVERIVQVRDGERERERGGGGEEEEEEAPSGFEQSRRMARAYLETGSLGRGGRRRVLKECGATCRYSKLCASRRCLAAAVQGLATIDVALEAYLDIPHIDNARCSPGHHDLLWVLAPAPAHALDPLLLGLLSHLPQHFARLAVRYLAEARRQIEALSRRYGMSATDDERP
jgi:hypothetical protein